MPVMPDFNFRVWEVLKYAMNTFLLVVLYSILQYIFDMHFVCPCHLGIHPNVVLYMVLPSFILTSVVGILEPFYQKRRCCGVNGCSYCCCDSTLKFIFRYISLTAVWITLFFFDGDWYICQRTSSNINQTEIPCRTNLSYEDQRIKDGYMTQSLDIGFYVSCPFLFLWSMIDIRRAHWKRSKAGELSGCCPPYYHVVYEDLLAEEISNHLNVKLQEIAKKRAEIVCAPYIQDIEDHQQNYGTDELSEVWKTISDPGFFWTVPERRESPV